MADKPQAPANWREVSKDEFFRIIGPRDVNPHVRLGSLKGRYFASDWEAPTRQRIGFSLSDSWGIEAAQWWLP